MKRTERTPQTGRAEFSIEGHLVAVRVATAPAVNGEKLALRPLESAPARLRLHELGLGDGGLALLTQAIDDATGLVLIGGPAGAGKTTTAYAILHELSRTDRCVVTVEEPVEYAIDGITQVQVNERQGLGFAAGLRGLLRLSEWEAGLTSLDEVQRIGGAGFYATLAAEDKLTPFQDGGPALNTATVRRNGSA
ncbi:MAG: ATPase, T2SS/T4P/T4SS family [Verrucomicrobiota bacterium]